MKLLFLDVDGVLNCHERCELAMSTRIDVDKVARLNRVLVSTDARIVLSSAWRYLHLNGHFTLEGLGWLLRTHGIADRLVGVTQPDTIERKWNGKDQMSWPLTNERGAQISAYVRKHDPTKYAVVDDLDLGISEAGHPFVHVDPTTGLTDEHVGLLERMLK